METEYLLMFFVILFFSFISFGKWKEKKQPSHPSPPSIPSLPIVGSLPFLRGFDNMPKYFMEKSHELDPVFTFRAGSKLVLVLNNKETIEDALAKRSRSFSSRPEIFMQKITNPNLKGLGFRDTTPEWKRIHQNTLSVLRDFGFGDKSIMEERILREVEAMVDFGRNKGGKPFDPKELFFLVTSNVIMNILLSKRQDYDLGISELILKIDEYTHFTDMVFDIAPFLKFIQPFKSRISKMKSCGNKIIDILETEIDKILQGNKKCFASEFIKREGLDFDRENLCFLLRDFFAGGTDTTANTMRWAMVALANNPKFQKKLQEEIDSVIPRDRYPTLQDQQKLPYVEATIHELYRWRTLIPLSIAHYSKHDAILKDFFIPAGTLVYPNLHAAHNDIAVWKDPDVFCPDRFLDDENNVVGLDRVIAFSLGRRSCPGETLARAEIFLILTSCLQRFTILPPEGQDKICDRPSLPVDLVLTPEPFSIRLVER